jgi:hypothetical protein
LSSQVFFSINVWKAHPHECFGLLFNKVKVNVIVKKTGDGLRFSALIREAHSCHCADLLVVALLGEEMPRQSMLLFCCLLGNDVELLRVVL